MRTVWREGFSLGLLGLLALGLAGCGDSGVDDRPRQPISGTVNFDGQPLKKGFIQFHPASEAEGMAAGGMIVEGRFAIPQDEGPVPGKYKVQINSLDDAEPAPLAEGEMPGAIQVPDRKAMPRRTIPNRYNAQSILTAEVKPNETNTYKFDLEK